MRRAQILGLIILCYIFQRTEEVIQNNSAKYTQSYKVLERDVLINKVSLTQNGYIQFLKYITDVPPITDYTFCIWLRSHNLTHNHPILSYSKNEEESLIRVWIASYGKSINLEISGVPIFEFPSNFIENRWYHICQSWSSFQAAWSLYINGKLKSTGSVPKLRGSFIKGGGDIVVGQEYTDFDKGLDDGIEGDISGFNFVLSSTNNNQKYNNQFSNNRKYQKHQQKTYPQVKIDPYQISEISQEVDSGGLEKYKTIPDEEYIQPDSSGYAVVDSKRNPKGILDLFRNIFSSEPTRVRVLQKPQFPKGYKITNRRSSDRYHLNEVGETRKSLGLLLVELSLDCGYRKGSPLSGKGVLVNWNHSPVRVFGGAILKSIPAFCYDTVQPHITT
ncbi:C-reactive protein 1.1-like [Diabrotica undecimpunctata]|uniref:C-reactive protein 1.1-like n=1 Tax=Diabrotica undecimpunctata TaxID=50387 RepID=UPI003B63A2B5